MSKRKRKIDQRINALGYYWTGEKELLPDDGIENNVDGRATYHVYISARKPSRQRCWRFDTLEEIENYLDEVEEWNTEHRKP